MPGRRVRGANGGMIALLKFACFCVAMTRFRQLELNGQLQVFEKHRTARLEDMIFLTSTIHSIAKRPASYASEQAEIRWQEASAFR